MENIQVYFDVNVLMFSSVEEVDVMLGKYRMESSDKVT